MHYHITQEGTPSAHIMMHLVPFFSLSSVVSAPMKRKKTTNIQIMIMTDVKIYVEKNSQCAGIHVGKGVDSSRIVSKYLRRVVFKGVSTLCNFQKEGGWGG